MTTVEWVYPFGELKRVEERLGGDWGAVKGLLGGKGANLADMTRLGVPVPPGFTVTTAACNAFLAQDETLPDGLWEQTLTSLEVVEKLTDREFGSPSNPLLLSSRSGGKISMPGMMDTILNLGLNDEVAEGLVAASGDERFVYDLYRRLVQMLGGVVLGVPDELFEGVLRARREARGVELDAELTGEDWRELVAKFKDIVRSFTGEEFPNDPHEQLRLSIIAVFQSWNSRRAIDYRNASGIPHDLGTAVNIQAMVFGNLGPDSGTGVAMSRNSSTGAPELEGDFLLNAQGEDVVAGIRKTRPLSELHEQMPAIYEQFESIARRLEQHYRNMQDMEFTIERGKLWVLQTRDGKRTAQAEVRIAADMVAEGLIDEAEAVRRVQPAQVDFFLHPQLDAGPDAEAPIASGLNVSPGAAVGRVAFDADTAQRWAGEAEHDVIMVRPETKPDDVHGMLASAGVVTARGGRTSHAALVARQFGKPAVVGVEALEIDLEAREMTVGEVTIQEGDWISLDGTNGKVYLGKLATLVPDLENPHLLQILEWADGFRRLDVRANADYPRDAERARAYGARGIGLCRTEHMFFETERLPIVRRMILANSTSERNEAIAELLPFQRADFAGLFRAMDGFPVIVRLLDPPLHEFLPAYEELLQDLADLKMRLQHMHTMSELDDALDEIGLKRDYLGRVETLRETNPMLGMRGVRLGILIPELTRMQVRAIIEAACICSREGVTVLPEVMIPLTGHVRELEIQRRALEEEAREVIAEQGIEVAYKFGTMIELPRAALTAGEMAREAEFFSFGTNDLTQTTFGISRDDAESGFLMHYIKNEILPDNPFETIDASGVGRLIEIAVQEGRAVRPDLKVGICGEHGGDPRSIALCHRLGLDYVSCSPFRVPIARLAAAHAKLEEADAG
ncbi:MAG: pyruvate, phosphate dikinase [Myxococcales bacterium]|nr:pyruvate, phosphate dikinase [Myxococcales bacterium]